jgi:hypothetical protein
MVSLTIFLLSILLILFLVHLIVAPTIDFARDGKILLWYGRKERKYIVLKDSDGD